MLAAVIQNGNGVGDLPLDITQKLNGLSAVADGNISIEYIGNQPNIHPGCIPSTGRNGRTATNQLQQQQQHLLLQPSTVQNGDHSAAAAGGLTQSLSGGLSSVSLGGSGDGGSNSNGPLLMPLVAGTADQLSAINLPLNPQLMQQLFQNSSEIIWPHP